MGKDISFKNHDRFIHLGIAIAALRKCVGCHRNSWLKKRGSAVLLSVQSKHLDWQRAFHWTYSLTLLTRLILILPI